MNQWHQRRRALNLTPSSFNSANPDSDYQRDRARVIHSAAFRRLQSKTQVLGIGESDFYRTRLTHSLEVAQIGSGICEYLREQYHDDAAITLWIPSMSLMEVICLCHDIGHPPFGHGGEVALNRMMDLHGGFEGNGQTLRIIARLGEYSPDQGLDLTRRSMLGVLKYPCLYSDTKNYPADIQQRSSMNIDAWIPPKCILDDEADILAWILSPFSKQDRNAFTALELREERHHRSLHKSFDTSIMEIADDIAYGVHDLEDALAMRLVSFQSWQSEVIEPLIEMGITAIAGKELEFYNDKLFSGCNKDRKHAISKLVNFFVGNIEIINQDEFEHPLLSYQATLRSPAQEVLGLFKNFIFKNVIKSPEVQAFEYKGQQMILKLFEVLQENPQRLLPENTQREFAYAENKQRVICDYIAGMTDSYATRLYHKLFTPDMGSIFDRL